MAICFGGADINSVLTLLMNPPPATNLYANCHGNSGISHIFLLFIQLRSTAAIYNTCRKNITLWKHLPPRHSSGQAASLCPFHTALNKPPFAKTQLQMQAVRKKHNHEDSQLGQYLHQEAISLTRFVAGEYWIMLLDHATTGKGVTSPFALCGGAFLQGPS